MKTVFTYSSASEAIASVATIMRRIEKHMGGKKLHLNTSWSNKIQICKNNEYGEIVFRIEKECFSGNWVLQFPEDSEWLNPLPVAINIWD